MSDPPTSSIDPAALSSGGRAAGEPPANGGKPQSFIVPYPMNITPTSTRKTLSDRPLQLDPTQMDMQHSLQITDAPMVRLEFASAVQVRRPTMPPYTSWLA